jgi:hypothetical protein
MKVFVIKRVVTAKKDEAQAMTVVAEDEATARVVAAGKAWDEGCDVWLEQAKATTCELIASEAIGDRRVVMMDINRG